MLRRRLAFGASAVLLAALVVSVGAVVKYASHAPVAVPGALSPTTALSPPAHPIPPPVPVGPARPPAPVPFPVDDRGFLNSGARCDGTRTAVAIGRTPGSLVVICGDGDGRYGYLGVRLRDDAVLRTPATATPAHEFIAQNVGVTYAISPAGLVVSADGAIIKREPMIDYREPRP